MKYAVLALVALVLVTGCGTKPLSDDQRNTVKEVLGSMSETVSASKSAQNRKGAPAGKTSEILNDTQKSIADKLSGAECELEAPKAGSGGVDFGSINLKVSGDRCPLVMEVGMKIKGSEKELEAEFRMFLEIRDAELAKLVDVTKVDISGTIKGSQSSANGTIQGSIKSKKYGDVKVSGRIAGSESEVSMEVEYRFSDFALVLKTVQAANKEPEYFVNGEKKTAQEFQAITAGSSAIGGAAPVQSPTSTSSTSLSYEYSETISGSTCSTGRQEFTSKEALCEGLKDYSRNRYCATSARRSRFESEQCPGNFSL